MLKWPKGRNGHASAIINTTSSNYNVTSHLIVMGGMGGNRDTLSDCWIMNSSSLMWYQV